MSLGVGLLLLSACTAFHPAGGGGPPPWLQADGNAYRVRKGDTLSEIASRYGMAWPRLAAANGIRSPNRIYAGQVLRIPQDGEPARRTLPAQSSRPSAVASVPEPTKSPGPSRGAVLEEVAAREQTRAEPRLTRTVSTEPVAPPQQVVASEPEASAPPPLTDGVYRVRAGDHLLAIARKFGVPMQQIVALNDLEAPYALRIGQKLQLPVAVADAPTPSAKPVAHIAAPALSGDGFLWPVRGKIVGRFGQSDDGLRRDGINIAARKGTPVRAAEDGVVVYADEGIRGYGRMILLRHDEDYITTYAHNAALLAEVGDVVSRGQIIARVGDTGSVDHAQLHFELRKGRKPLDPERLLVRGRTALASSQ